MPYAKVNNTLSRGGSFRGCLEGKRGIERGEINGKRNGENLAKKGEDEEEKCGLYFGTIGHKSPAELAKALQTAVSNWRERRRRA